LWVDVLASSGLRLRAGLRAFDQEEHCRETSEKENEKRQEVDETDSAIRIRERAGLRHGLRDVLGAVDRRTVKNCSWSGDQKYHEAEAP
jgi:hypothetical protein